MTNAQKVGILVLREGRVEGRAGVTVRQMESNSESHSTFASEQSFEVENFCLPESLEIVIAWWRTMVVPSLFKLIAGREGEGEG